MKPPSFRGPDPRNASMPFGLNKLSTDHVLLGVRLTAAALFGFSGVTKAILFNEALAEFASLGLGPIPLILTIFVQCTGSFLLASGVSARIAALALALFTFAATLLAHAPWPLAESFEVHQTTIVLEHLVIIAALMTVVAMGSGRFSLLQFHPQS